MTLKADYEKGGFLLIRKVFAADLLGTLVRDLTIFEKEINNYGVRNLMNKVPSIRALATTPPLLSMAQEILGDSARPVRAVFFDKVPEANWNVAWHQDTSIAVNTKIDIPGFGPWSEKQGIIHVEPPEEYLARILTVRVHLDPTDSDNGVLRIVPETHHYGRVASKTLVEIVERSAIVECNADPGDVLLMSPLLFHSSRKSSKPSHRRVIHIEYSAMTLPKPLDWYESGSHPS